MKEIIKKLLCIIKLFVAYLISIIFCKKLKRKNIWLICEKLPEARDNGYHFYKYVKENHPEIPAYYVITPDSADLHKIKKYGNIISANSMKHYIYYLCAKMSINSQPGGASPTPRGVVLRFGALKRKDQKTIFLRHGITKDYIDYAASSVDYDLFVCSTDRELTHIRSTCGYPENVAVKIGLCRYDNLHRNMAHPKKQILIMPTFRKWLKASSSDGTASASETERFMNSEYFRTYSAILTNRKLLGLMDSYGYKLVFYPHFAMQPYIHCFDRFGSEKVLIADRKHYDVQQLLIDSAVMITDFSSVFFDFAFMKKPEVFFQFDREKFRSGHYKEGYFDYSRDGFGPVFDSTEEVIQYIEKLLKNGCKPEPVYLKRIDDFFGVQDGSICEKTYRAILDLK